MAVATVVLAGCQGGGIPSPTPPPATPSTVPTPSKSSAPGTESIPPTSPAEPEPFSPKPVDSDSPGPSDPAYPWITASSEQEATSAGAGQEITDVRVGSHDGYDRVVLDLTDKEPGLGWYAGFVEEAIQDPSGDSFDIEGEAFLQVLVQGIDWATESPDRYDGGPVAGEGADIVTEVQFGGLFEGQQQVVIGLRGQSAYRIFTLADPARIVIDVQHE